MSYKKINRALISVFDKGGIDEIALQLKANGVEILSTGGTQDYLENLGIEVKPVEELTDYPSILDGRVKTLHPAVFGGILARSIPEHQKELEEYKIPTIDLVIVDLYPFEETLKSGGIEQDIIEKIDIGGISLIRAAAKNFHDVLVVPSKNQYGELLDVLQNGDGSEVEFRRQMAAAAFRISSAYDNLIAGFMAGEPTDAFVASSGPEAILRYGENPHQEGWYYGDIDKMFDIIQGKELSYNNLNDIEAAISLMRDLPEGSVSCAIFKHTNACGVAVRKTAMDAWRDALAGDPISAFGGIIIFNSTITEEVAAEIDKIFYEVLIAPEFTEGALGLLGKKKNRILLRLKEMPELGLNYKSLLNGILVQDADARKVVKEDLNYVTKEKPTTEEIEEMLFANICVKHLKSNGIALTKNMQIIGIGTGQTSRVDALNQAIEKAKRLGFDLKGGVMASDAFFPFPDCVEIAHVNGINLVIQPGGSIKDNDSIDFCDKRNMKMVTTGIRHFKHG